MTIVTIAEQEAEEGSTEWRAPIVLAVALQVRTQDRETTLDSTATALLRTSLVEATEIRTTTSAMATATAAVTTTIETTTTTIIAETTTEEEEGITAMAITTVEVEGEVAMATTPMTICIACSLS